MKWTKKDSCGELSHQLPPGGITAIGSNVKGTQQLEGYFQRAVYSSKNLNTEEIGILKQKKEINTGKTSLNTTFNFEAGYKGSQTNRISSMKNNEKEISYTYDKNGNIETIKSEGKLIKYHYNSLNEVIREDNETLGKTIVYNYDVGGNITSKTEYEYKGSQKLGKEIKTYNYAYGDANWKDKLTNFDGKEITYDQIGNPLSYDGYNFT